MHPLAMFDAFELEQSPEHVRRLTGATAVALAVMALGAAALFVWGNMPVRPRVEKKVDVAFRPLPPATEPAKIENPPPPPPKPVKARPPVAEPPPAPGPAAMVAPTEVPKAPAPESEQPVAAIAVAVGGHGDGKTPADAAPPPPDDDESEAPVVASAAAHGPVNLPEDADPPEPDEGNSAPEYPESARTIGQEARVVLKIVVEADGRVGRIQVLKGEEPFTSAALVAVKQWKYEPAQLDGQPIAVFKIVDLKFRLRE